MKNLSVPVLAALLVGALGTIVFLSSATVSPKVRATAEVCFCHNINNNPITVCTDNSGLINGHQGHVDKGSDSLGACAETETHYACSENKCELVEEGGSSTCNVDADCEDNAFHFACVENACALVDGAGTDSCDITSENDCLATTPTPTPTPTPGNPGGPGDGLSDGRSDGRSSCPECTKAPTGQVLGATTEFAATGVTEDLIMNGVGALGGISTVAGMALITKKKSN